MRIRRLFCFYSDHSNIYAVNLKLKFLSNSFNKSIYLSVLTTGNILGKILGVGLNMRLHIPISAEMLFKVFKYAVYFSLTFNIFLFFQEESLATQETFSQGIGVTEIIQGYAATIDTAAWVLLLILFELTTFILPQSALSQSRVKVTFMAVRIFCYGFILYSFYGYFTKMLLINGISPFFIDDVCALTGQNFSAIDNLDEYPLLTFDNCGLLRGEDLLVLNGQSIIGTAQQWIAIQRLTWVDVVNSMAWILIVLVLELDIRLRNKKKFTKFMLMTSRVAKLVLYAAVLLAAVYWGFLGDFLDFWDAFLWLVAFFFIELNIFSKDKKQLAF